MDMNSSVRMFAFNVLMSFYINLAEFAELFDHLNNLSQTHRRRLKLQIEENLLF